MAHMMNAQDGAFVGEPDPVVADTQAEGAGVFPFESLYVTVPRFYKTLQAGEDSQCGGNIQPANIGLGLIRPGNLPFQAGSL
jgi:hypothetical protein